MSNKTGAKAQRKSMPEQKAKQEKQPIGINISQAQWNTITAELSVFKQTVVDGVIGVINKNSTPLFAEEKAKK